jgi:putative hydrolase of the HAD superfamily
MQKAEKKVKAVVFDLGYTLINFSGNLDKVARASHLALVDYLIQLGYDLDREAFAKKFSELMHLYYEQRERDLLELPVHGIVLHALEDLVTSYPTKEQVVAAIHEMYLVTEKHWKLEDDTLSTLDCLQNKGYQLGLITNASDAWDVNNLIDDNHLRQYFSAIVISAEEGFRKPDRRIFEKAAERLSLQFNEMVMVGDTLHADILGAKKCGMKTVWISRRAEYSREMLKSRSDLTPDGEIHALNELPDLLDSWSTN